MAILILGATRGKWLSLLILPFAGVIYELAAGAGPLLASPAMVFLGSASYSVYLLQFPVRNWIRLLSAALSIPDTMGAVLSPVVLVPVSVLAFRFLEEPARRTLKRWFAGRENGRPGGRLSPPLR